MSKWGRASETVTPEFYQQWCGMKYMGLEVGKTKEFLSDGLESERTQMFINFGFLV